MVHQRTWTCFYIVKCPSQYVSGSQLLSADIYFKLLNINISNSNGHKKQGSQIIRSIRIVILQVYWFIHKIHVFLTFSHCKTKLSNASMLQEPYTRRLSESVASFQRQERTTVLVVNWKLVYDTSPAPKKDGSD